MAKFKVGDRVRYNAKDDFACRKDGEIGTVESYAHGDNLNILWDGDTKISHSHDLGYIEAINGGVLPEDQNDAYGNPDASHDPVTKPAHYASGAIECIDAIRSALTPEEFRGYCKGNMLKYAWRERGKNGDEDLRKAAVYAGFAAEASDGQA